MYLYIYIKKVEPIDLCAIYGILHNRIKSKSETKSPTKYTIYTR